MIGNNVWIGLKTVILKGVSIPDGCIVGAGSLVSSALVPPPSSLIIGNPAQVKKNNIKWIRERI